MKLATKFVTGLNLSAGLLCFIFVFGVAWAGSSIMAYLALGFVVPILATPLVTFLYLKLEGQWNRTLFWINTFAYTPIYFLLSGPAIGSAIRDHQPVQLFWFGFGCATALVSSGSALLVRDIMKNQITPPTEPDVHKPAFPGVIVFLSSAIVGTIALYGASITFGPAN